MTLCIMAEDGGTTCVGNKTNCITFSVYSHYDTTPKRIFKKLMSYEDIEFIEDYIDKCAYHKILTLSHILYQKDIFKGVFNVYAI